MQYIVQGFAAKGFEGINGEEYPLIEESTSNETVAISIMRGFMQSVHHNSACVKAAKDMKTLHYTLRK